MKNKKEKFDRDFTNMENIVAAIVYGVLGVLVFLYTKYQTLSYIMIGYSVFLLIIVLFKIRLGRFFESLIWGLNMPIYPISEAVEVVFHICGFFKDLKEDETESNNKDKKDGTQSNDKDKIDDNTKND